MTLPDPVVAFWHAEGELHPICRRTPWGLVKSDHRYPMIWDANHAAVLGHTPGLTIDDIRAELLPVLDSAGAVHEHVELWDFPADSRLVREAHLIGQRHDPDVVMVSEAAGAQSSPIEAREIVQPDEAFWRWHRDTRREFGEVLDDEVLDQLLERDREVFHPAGLRWFVGFVDGRMAGFASLLSLEAVGYVDNVVTLAEFRRRGVATATVTRAVRAGLEAGDRLVHLLAEEGGSPRALYERLGFRVVARVESFTRRLEPEKEGR